MNYLNQMSALERISDAFSLMVNLFWGEMKRREKECIIFGCEVHEPGYFETKQLTVNIDRASYVSITILYPLHILI